MTLSSPESRIELYLTKHAIELHKKLGLGSDGTVWFTTRTTAVKAFLRQQTYQIELECYRRLAARKVTEVYGFTVPSLVHWDDELLIIEMSVVQPPFILDFGKVYLDSPPMDFSTEAMSDWEERHQELWGAQWKTIKRILSKLRGFGIYQIDPKPGNIMPANWDPDL